jgi:uncharacterized membrane protein
VLATGLYAISRALERGEPATLATALRAWQPTDHRMIVFGLLLALAGTGWVLTSAALITSALPGQVNRPVDFVRLVVLAEQGLLFETWLVLGALMAAPVFASSVMAMPMLMDRRVGVLGAVFTSWRAVMEHPAPMALWALLLMGLTALGMATVMLGLVVVMPWLAHASWHALPRLGEDAWRFELMFGFNEEQIANFGLTVGVTAFMLYMAFIIFQLARESRPASSHLRALPGPGVGLLGFAAKGLIKFFMAGIVE